MNEKDIKNLSMSFAGRAATSGRIVFGVRRSKKLKSMMHWVQDFYRMSSTPTIDSLNEATFTDALTKASARVDVRELMFAQSEHK